MPEYLINDEGNDLDFPGKVAVVSCSVSVNEDTFRSAEQLLAKYGEDKIIHVIWPDIFTNEQEQMISLLAKLAENKEIKALIINHAVLGTNAAVDELRKMRDDIFIVYCTLHEPFLETSARANLILHLDELGMGQAMVKQAQKQGAGTFVHYSFPRHLSLPLISTRIDLTKKVCKEEGIVFVDVEALDPMGEAGNDAARQFILEDVPKKVTKYGENTAFFCTNCQLQAQLIKAVVDSHAIYPQPCCPSPFHGFPQALGIDTSGAYSDLNYVISEACRIAGEKNMTDRLSTWPVSTSMMFGNAGAEYAIKCIKGIVPRNHIDERALEDCMSDYIMEVVGERVEVSVTSYSENNVNCDNIKLVLMSYLDL